MGLTGCRFILTVHSLASDARWGRQSGARLMQGILLRDTLPMSSISSAGTRCGPCHVRYQGKDFRARAREVIRRVYFDPR
jgi:hypothetical protein